MTKLLRADLFRLRKNKLFYLLLAVMAALGIWLPLMQHHANQTVFRNGGGGLTPDSGFGTFGIAAVMALSALVPLFIGTDHSDGTIRNKLIVGHRRADVYLSEFLVCMTALLLLDLAFLVPFLSLSLPLLGPFMLGAKATVVTGLYTLAMEMAFTALYVTISMLCQSKAYSAVLCIALCAGLLFAGMTLNAKLAEPEMRPPSMQLVMGENGVDDAEFVEHPEEPNPSYVGGAARQVLQFLYDFIPGGQAIELSIPSGERPWTMPGYSGVILLLSTAGGLCLFQKKNLK